MLLTICLTGLLTSLDAANERVATYRAQALEKAVKTHYVTTAEWPANLADVAVFLQNGKEDLLDPWGKRYRYVIQSEISSDGQPIQRPYIWTEREVSGKVRVYGKKPGEK